MGDYELERGVKLGVQTGRSKPGEESSPLRISVLLCKMGLFPGPVGSGDMDS